MEGYTVEQIQKILLLLRGEGLVHTVVVGEGIFGPSRGAIEPSTLTEKGRAYLKSLEPDENGGA